MGIKLYGTPPSPPSHSARLMLERKGINEERRTVVADHLTAATSAIPANAVIAASMWLSLGEPEIPSEF